MNREFLKEAISDAKTMKESAIANAKVALEEAFSPQLQSMFASKIEEMDNMEMEEGYDEMEEAKDEAKVEGEMSNPIMRTGLKGDNKAEKETEYDREVDEDMDLDEILAELENELEESTPKRETLKEEESDEDAEEEGYLDGMEDEKEDVEGEDDEEIDLEEMSEDDLKDFIEDEENIEVEDEVEVTVDEDVSKRNEEVVNENLRKDLKEAMNTVVTLKTELNEINLLNAKLLYVNKIYKTKNLNESQKAKVLGAFDKASTVKEVKIVFNTINENFTFKKKTVNESRLGSASKSVISPKVTKKKPIVESDEMVNRFQKLAGIIK